jgi:hypothetical protein
VTFGIGHFLQKFNLFLSFNFHSKNNGYRDSNDFSFRLKVEKTLRTKKEKKEKKRKKRKKRKRVKNFFSGKTPSRRFSFLTCQSKVQVKFVSRKKNLKTKQKQGNEKYKKVFFVRKIFILMFL